MICNKIIPIDKPYQFCNRHDIEPLVLGGIIAGGASLLSSGINAISNAASNRSGANLNATNRAWNERMLDKQNQFNIDQWNRENQYNTASAQRARLEAAGLNPYLMMNGGSAGVASSVSSASPGSASTNFVPTPYDASGIASAGSQIGTMVQQQALIDAQVRKSNAEAAGSEIQNKYLDTQLQENINNLISNRLNTDEQASLAAFQRASGLQLLGGNIQRQYIENQNLLQERIESEARTTQIRYEAALTAANLSFLPQQVKSQLALNAAQAYAARSAGLLNDKQAQLVVEQKNSEVLRQYGIRCANYQQKYIAAKLSWESNKAKADALHSWNNVGPDNTTQWHNKYSGKTRQNIYHGINTFSPLIPSVGIGFSR